MCLPQVVVPPPHSTLVTGRCHLHKQAWWGKTQAFRLAYQGSTGTAHRMDFSCGDEPSVRLCNKVPSRQRGTTGLLDNPQALHQDRLRQGATTRDLRRPLEHFLSRSEEGHRQDAGCIDLCRPNERIWYEHFKMEGLHTIQQLIRRNDYITKVDLDDFYMHFLIGQANRRYMWFMWEGTKFQCIGMPFG